MSISLVRKELEATLQKAEGYFSLYAEEMEPNNLKLFADELNLARGTFKLLELSGPEALVTEMLSLVGDGAASDAVKIESLGQALIGLGHYISHLLEKEIDQPILLVPIINILRKAGGHKAITESHFFNVNLRPQLPSVEKSDLNIKPHLARLRLMYQAGLLRVIRGDDAKVGFKLIERSLALLEKGFRGTMAWGFWWVAQSAVSVMVKEDYELTVARKTLFGRLDLVMRSMIKEGPKVFTAAAANQVQKDLLLIVSLSSEDSGDAKRIKDCFKLSTELTESALKNDRKILSGPDINAYESLSKSIKEEIQSVKGALDSAAKDVLSDGEFEELSARLVDIAGVLKVVGQGSLAKKVLQQGEQVGAMKSAQGEAKVTALANIADALLQVELACDHFATGEVETNNEIVGAGHYFEARIVLFDEIQSGLTVAKRAIGNFLDSGDKIHLANISQALVGVKGGLIFLNQPKAAAVVQCAVQYIEKRVLNVDLPPDEARLEVLADALTSVEYYSETLSHSDDGASDILDLAIKSVGQLGFKIS
jgi:hypothetical protein